MLEQNFDFLYYGTGSIPAKDNAQGYLSQFEIPEPLHLPGPSMWFLFDSDLNVAYKGFELEWEAITRKC